VNAALPGVVTVVNQGAEHTDEQGQIFGSYSVGSGFIIDERGFVVTNEHVIRDAVALTVVLANGEERPAELVSRDSPFTDLAVLRIPAGKLQPLRWGDSDRLVLGETVVALGTALFEFRNSVTVGVVSGLQRRWLREGVFMEDLIQTDAMVNAGNSGGPLVNLAGEVVGINSTVVRTVGDVTTVTGVSFAISSRTMQPVVQSIIDRGSYPRPYFGIDHQDLDSEMLVEQRLPLEHGARVLRVYGDSPAAKAGIQAGDVVLRIGGSDVTETTPFINALSRVGVNDRLDVQVWREGRILNTSVQVTPR
jgi:2-alkenal reductase